MSSLSANEWIDIPFRACKDGTELHTLNNPPDQLQRELVTDELCKGLHTQVKLDQVLHGTNSNGTRASLITFTFRLVGSSAKRRFRKVSIRIRFKSERMPGLLDPEIASLWPAGDFFCNSTSDRKTSKFSVGVGNRDGPNSLMAFDFTGLTNVSARFEETTVSIVEDHSTLSGMAYIDKPYGIHAMPVNAVHFTLVENQSRESGVVRFLKTAVLLEHMKQAGTSKFSAQVMIEAEVDSKYTLTKGIQTLLGVISPTDPIFFDPTLPPKGTEELGEVDLTSLDSAPDLSTQPPIKWQSI
ncbi:hypothetical protein BJ508DRAFT_413635 [Ascobolus immersus RN42]|uniref:Uncharacterized protein n=1 Tax=Ascobolus immersus RN42 TaxID=1160509 RepID=A0A3N4IAW1_ASCIM|nr:hypothetical protein BJ508DRAFT_413635 [Ascobolus immersus RN42]